MTINAHVIRMDRRVSNLWPRTALQHELEKWHRSWDQYCSKVREHMSYGGQIERWRVITFRMIFRETVERIQNKLAMIDILEGCTVKPRRFSGERATLSRQ